MQKLVYRAKILFSIITDNAMKERKDWLVGKGSRNVWTVTKTYLQYYDSSKGKLWKMNYNIDKTPHWPL